MKPPTLKPGSLEQAVFTWTPRTVSNTRGQGYAAVSEGLGQSISWLESLDVKHFQLLDQLTSNTAAAYEAWRTFISVGYMRIGDIGIAYRKMADGGEDDRGRYRHIVHLIVGMAAEVDLSFALLLGHDQWLSPQECPLGMKMKLGMLRYDALRFDFDVLRHDCDQVDPLAKSLMEAILRERPGEWLRLSADQINALPTILHVAFPEACLATLELDCFVGTDGPAGYLRIRRVEDTNWSPSRKHSSSVAEILGSCLLYQEEASRWREIPYGTDIWQAYSRLVHDGSEGVGGWFAGPDNPEEGTLDRVNTSGIDDLNRAFRLVVDVRSARPDSSLGRDLNLTEDEALRFLRRCEDSGVFCDEVLNLTDWTLREVLGAIKARKGYNTVSQFLRDSDYELLLRRWRATGLGALGYALLQRYPTDIKGDNDVDLLPGRLLSEQLGVLFGHLIASDAGIQQLSLLLRYGFGVDRSSRSLFLHSLGEGRRFLYSRIVPGAALPSHQLLDMIRETFTEWCAFYRIPEEQSEALRSILFRRRTAFIDSILRRRSDTI